VVFLVVFLLFFWRGGSRESVGDEKLKTKKKLTLLLFLPTNINQHHQVTVYLCDDGKDPKKRRWCMAPGRGVVYVSGRTRASGEMNGKSANLNNCARQIYPDGQPIPPNEVICVFDADQVANPDFFLKMLYKLDAGDDVAMVLSPQSFYNTNLRADIFNHSNTHFWEYAQHGYDALGFISCTGTNFLIRSAAFRDAG
jgi:cellulose synthase/poly-beta-1,6-N-acetylglucosamine synthase-like glycosyltransferase